MVGRGGLVSRIVRLTQSGKEGGLYTHFLSENVFLLSYLISFSLGIALNQIISP